MRAVLRRRDCLSQPQLSQSRVAPPHARHHQRRLSHPPRAVLRRRCRDVHPARQGPRLGLLAVRRPEDTVRVGAQPTPHDGIGARAGLLSEPPADSTAQIERQRAPEVQPSGDATLLVSGDEDRRCWPADLMDPLGSARQGQPVPSIQANLNPFFLVSLDTRFD